MAVNCYKCTTLFNFNSIIPNITPQFLSKTSKLFSYKKYSVSVSTKQECDGNVIEFLNSSSPKTLENHALSPLLVQKIINTRQIKKLTLDDLPFLGFDRLKKIALRSELGHEDPSVNVQKLQNLIGNQSSLTKNDLHSISLDPIFKTSENYKLEKGSQKKISIFTFTAPNLKHYDLENVDTITAISIANDYLGVTTIQASGKIENMRVIPLLTDTNTKEPDPKNWTLHKICEKALLAAPQIPKSDLVIFEIHSKTPNSGLHLKMMETLLLALTDTWRGESDPHSSIFVKKSLVSKLYDLQIGNERISCVDVGEKILTGRRPLTWLPESTFSDLAIKRYILSTKEEKYKMIESLLLAIAFNSVYIKRIFGKTI